MRCRVLMIFAVLLCLAAAPASAQSIGVYFDPSGSIDCAGAIPPLTPATWYICARLFGPAANGIIGVEFRQDGTPAGWAVTATPSSDADIVLGDPLYGGVDLAFADCQAGSNGVVLIYTVHGIATTAVGCTTLQISRHTTPSNPNFYCPVVILCDAPVYTCECATGGIAYFNSACGEPGGCPVAVFPTSWSQVKNLFH